MVLASVSRSAQSHALSASEGGNRLVEDGAGVGDVLRVWVMAGRPGSGPAPMRSVGDNSLADRQSTAPPPARGARRLIVGRSAPFACSQHCAIVNPRPGGSFRGLGCGSADGPSPTVTIRKNSLWSYLPAGFLRKFPYVVGPGLFFFGPGLVGRARAAVAHERWAQSALKPTVIKNPANS